MSAGRNDSNGVASGGAQARAAAARQLLDLLIAREMSADQRREAIALLAALLATPLVEQPEPAAVRHPSVNLAIGQLQDLSDELQKGGDPGRTDGAPVDWDCAFVGPLRFETALPGGLADIALVDIAEGSTEIQRAIDWHQPFLDIEWNGWRLSGHPVFSLRDGRFTGYRGSVQPDRVRPVIVPPPSPDEEARLAHEVRSPLGAIVGFADMIVQQPFGPAPPAMRDAAQRILTTGATLLSALEDMTDAARLDLGRYPVDLGWIDVRPVLDQAMDRFASLAVDRQATLVVLGGQSIWMQVDSQALQRLVERLLAGVLSLAGQAELFELEAIPLPGDRIAISLTRPACLAGWSNDELRNPAIDVETPDSGDRAMPMVGLGFALRLVAQLAGRLGGSFIVEPHRFVVNLPALQAGGVASRAGAH